MASHRSEFGFPEVDPGILSAGGDTRRLLQLVGPVRTKQLCMTGERIDGETALLEGP
jgi:enoyl-CoA hydratase/carnithine racemase